MGIGRRQNGVSVLFEELHFFLPEACIERDVQFHAFHTEMLLTVLPGRTLNVASLLWKNFFQKSVQRYNKDVTLSS